MDSLDQVLLAVANYYYVAGLGQDEIARRLGTSRTSVSRMIAQARERNLINIQPRVPNTIRPGLAAYLAEQYGLHEVLIGRIDSQDVETMRADLGQIAACYLQSVLCDNLTLGISWGTFHTINALRPTLVRDCRVVQLAGGLNPAPGFGPPLNELVQALAAKLGGSAQYLFSPAIADSATTAEMLRTERSIAEGLAVASQTDVALFGIGDLGPGNSIPIASALRSEDWARVEAAGAVGAICVRFFDGAGRVALPEVDDRTIGIRLDQLVKIPLKIGVAGGLRKRAAALGALNGRLVDVLITDESLAMALLAERPAAKSDVTPSRWSPAGDEPVVLA
ncbi:MAG: sugar-binding transcriptional regulator [Chloroflexota bacterium]